MTAQTARTENAEPRELDDLLGDCVHCGFCLPTCPTYSLWHEEMDSPRGRIYLMQGLVDGSISLTDTVVEHFDRCLGCMACVSSCPSGVQYDRLIEQTRDYVEHNHRRGPLDRLVRAGIFAVFPHRRRLRAALLFRKLPAPGPLAPLKRIAPPWAAPEWPPEHLPNDGPRVALLAGCVASVVFGDVNAATARVLHADGFDVHVPRAQGCCGALHAHAGRLEAGISRARKLERDLAGYDYIVTNAAGCGSHLKDRGLPAVDLSEALLTAELPTLHPLDLTLAYQDSCHLRHAQRLPAAWQPLLARIPGLRVVEPAEQELCCGSAGIYNVTQPDAARALGDRKAANVLATQPDAYASANPGCLVQVAQAMGRVGRSVPALHPVELLDASLQGIAATDLLGSARR